MNRPLASNPPPPENKIKYPLGFPMSLWRLSRQSDMGSFNWRRPPGVALAALVYPRLPSLTTSWSVPNAQKTGCP